MKRYSYLLLLAVIFLGLVGPVIYVHRAQTGKPAEQSRTAEMKNASGNREKKENNATSASSPSQAGLQEKAAPTKANAQESQTNQSPQLPSKETQTPPSSEEATVVKVAVIGQDGRLLYGPAEVKLRKENPLGTTALAALDATGLPYTVSTRFSGFVDSIAGQRNRGQSGWMYSVNGELPSVAASQKAVKQGDKVLWWYSRSMDQAPPSWDELAKYR